MLCRSTIIRHPSGLSLKTPLLVPSFSSRGFRFDAKGKSEIRDVFANTAEILTESMLISAYDIFYKHLPKPEKFPCTPEIIFVDSGGYETGADHDHSAVFHYVHRAKKWDLKRYIQVLDNWPSRIPAVVVNFDIDSIGMSVPIQIAKAKEIFSRFPQHMHNFLIKPTRSCKGTLVNTVKILESHVKELAGFHIIGVTEKELGHKTLDRMETIAMLRRSLDRSGVTAPIQVFGALDPLSASIYFLAGAEIFDGLTWLRFAYSNGQCIYSHTYGPNHMLIDSHDDIVKAKMFSDNYYELRKLQLAMKDFVYTRDFSKLKPHDIFLKSACDSLNGRISGGA